LASVPIAAFLTGALLSLLLPVAALIALAVWYWAFSVRVPETSDTSGSAAPPAAADAALTHPAERATTPHNG
jgi:hypothetical protein